MQVVDTARVESSLLHLLSAPSHLEKIPIYEHTMKCNQYEWTLDIIALAV